MGYGVISFTLLVSFGVVPAIASASIHTAEIFVNIASGRSHFKLGNVKKELLKPLVLLGIIGAAIGAYGLVRLPLRPVKITLGIILFVIGSLLVFRFIFKDKHIKFIETKNKKYSFTKLGFLGFFAALMHSLAGGGWGPLLTPSLMIDGHEPAKAVGTVSIARIFVAISATLTFLIFLGFEQFRWDIIFVFILSGFIAAPIGAYICKKLPHKTLGIIVGLLVVFLSIRIILKTLGIF